MTRGRLVACVAMVALAAGCARGGAGPVGGGGLNDAENLGLQRQQAREALARYDDAIAGTGSGPRFIPVGELTAQIGDWEPANFQNKAALGVGRLEATTALPAPPARTGTVVWDSGATLTVALIPADEALRAMASGGGDCGGCTPLAVTGARLSTAKVQTTRGPATVPAWEYTLRGTAVRVTRVAVAGSATVTVTPPSWDSFHPPAGLTIDSATTTTGSSQLTVTFTGAPDPASRPCGVDYTGEAVESTNAVAVIIIEHPHAANETCALVGAPRTATVGLVAPLGERAVLEVRQGLPIPVTITG